MTLCSSVFSISVFNFEQVKSRLGSKNQRSKKRWYSSFILRKKPSQLRTCDTSKTVIFCENSLQFFREIVTILTRSSIFRSFTWCKICLGYFFRFTFIIDLYSSSNIFKYYWNINSAHKCLFDNRDTTTIPTTSFGCFG